MYVQSCSRCGEFEIDRKSGEIRGFSDRAWAFIFNSRSSSSLGTLNTHSLTHTHKHTSMIFKYKMNEILAEAATAAAAEVEISHSKLENSAMCHIPFSSSPLFPHMPSAVGSAHLVFGSASGDLLKKCEVSRE